MASTVSLPSSEPSAGLFTDPQEARLEKLRARRDHARWYAVAGVGLLFAASFHTGFLIGGVLMVLYGATLYGVTGRQIAKIEDPWNDPELDEWEARELSGEPHPDEEDEDLW
jgi:hypothetical protein